MDEKRPSTMTPRLRFPAFGNAPEWSRVALSSIADPVTTRAEIGEPAPVLTLSGEHGIVLQSEYFGKQIAGSDSDRYTKVVRDDFVYNDRTTKQSAYGTIKRLSKHPGGIVSPIYKCFRFDARQTPAFWDFYFESGIHNAELRELVNEGARTGRFNISIDKFLSTSAWQPEGDEQRKIAECLTALDDAVAARIRKLTALKAHKRGLMQQLFPSKGESLPRLRFPEFRDTPAWTEHPFERFVVTSFYGTSSSTTEKGQYPVLRMGNMVDGGLDFNNLAYLDLDRQSFEDIRLIRGDILLNRTNSLDLVGKVSMFDRDINCITASYIVTFRLDQERLKPLFCNALLNSPRVQAQIKALARPSVSQANINPTTFRKELTLSVPPTTAEQQRIADCLFSLGAQVAAESSGLDALRAHKKGLMQQLFPSPEEQ